MIIPDINDDEFYKDLAYYDRPVLRQVLESPMEIERAIYEMNSDLLRAAARFLHNNAGVEADISNIKELLRHWYAELLDHIGAGNVQIHEGIEYATVFSIRANRLTDIDIAAAAMVMQCARYQLEKLLPTVTSPMKVVGDGLYSVLIMDHISQKFDFGPEGADLAQVLLVTAMRDVFEKEAPLDEE